MTEPTPDPVKLTFWHVRRFSWYAVKESTGVQQTIGFVVGCILGLILISLLMPETELHRNGVLLALWIMLGVFTLQLLVLLGINVHFYKKRYLE